MPDTVPLKIVTPEGTALEEDVSFARFPGKAGEIGVYPSHSATLAEVKEGFITLEKDDNVKEYYFISKGFLHIRPDQVLLLTPTIEKQSEIDSERAEKAKKRAEDRLHIYHHDHTHHDHTSIDANRARQAFLRAEERLHTTSLGK